MSCCRFLVLNGVVTQTVEVPQVASFLENHPGAYTTTRTHNNGMCVLFWERHLNRLAESARILAESRPSFLFGPEKARASSSFLSRPLSSWELVMRRGISDSLMKVLPISLKERNDGEELAITTLVSGYSDNLEGDEKFSRSLDVYVHIGMYIPPLFGVTENGAHLAVVGRGRDVAGAKFSEWVRIRKSLENLRPPLANELVLSNDGDRILEGCLTNFFVVCRKENTFEVQTAPLSDGVLPGIIRQLVIEVCLNRGIPCREVAPRWSDRELWQEAFVTNGLRLVQHVETIEVPTGLWELLPIVKTWKEVNWEKKFFEEGPGILTSEIQKEIMKRAELDGYSVSDLTR
ncbi:hypothetical protein ACHQM5_021719 [Ranunculus cassubicifolius]